MKKYLIITLLLLVTISFLSCVTILGNTKTQSFAVKDLAVCIDDPVNYDQFIASEELSQGVEFWVYLSWTGMKGQAHDDGTRTVKLLVEFIMINPQQEIEFQYFVLNGEEITLLPEENIDELSWLAVPHAVPRDAMLGKYELRVNMTDILQNKSFTTSIYFVVK